MAKLQPYNPNARCPKCGHDQISTLYEENSMGHGTTTLVIGRILGSILTELVSDAIINGVKA